MSVVTLNPCRETAQQSLRCRKKQTLIIQNVIILVRL